MSKQRSRRVARKRPQPRRGRTAAAARGRSDRTAWIVAAIVIAIGGALVLVFASATHGKRSGFFKGVEPAPAALVAQVTSVPKSTIDRVGEGKFLGRLPRKVSGPPLRTAAGLPRVVYLGAEYCPYCATERWAMVQALARFGTFEGLKITTSAVTTPNGSAEIDPATATFSFRGATYTSRYLRFEAVEQKDNSYKTLDTPTAEQAHLAATYDIPPYASVAGSIPFIDFANRYVITGATYDAGVLQGKTHDQIAAALRDPATDIAQGSVGSANVITATICKLTANAPADVCNDAAVATIEHRLG
jgi:uncharacterized protein DUF929